MLSGLSELILLILVLAGSGMLSEGRPSFALCALSLLEAIGRRHSAPIVAQRNLPLV